MMKKSDRLPLPPSLQDLPRIKVTAAPAPNAEEAKRPDKIYGVTTTERLLREVSLRLGKLPS